MATPFLSAFWRNLVVINYEVDPSVLSPLLPLGTELDLFENKALMSVIAFNFERTKLFGILPTVPVTDFEEINLRFYVRRTVGEEVRRGVVFVKEVVPSALVAATARILYNEPYEARPMSHSFDHFDNASGGTLSYETQVGSHTVSIHATTDGEQRTLQAGSIEEFILEHYWGYTQQDDGTTSEYRVHHEPWRYWETRATQISGDITALYPPAFKDALNTPPHSSFVARGSPVEVFAYRRFHPSTSTSAFPQRDAQGYLLFDGGCGFCSWWISRMSMKLKRIGIASAPLQSSWVEMTLSIPSERIAEDIRLILADGTILSGASVYIYLLKRMRWARPLGLLLGLPLLRSGTWWVYRIFNRNRFVVSRVCKLEPHRTEKSAPQSSQR
jgi:uncharacterized protein YqjF (DUF2071 family)/predicted DCC family thiol-disulfide oxidoreductase YuxK